MTSDRCSWPHACGLALAGQLAYMACCVLFLWGGTSLRDYILHITYIIYHTVCEFYDLCNLSLAFGTDVFRHCLLGKHVQSFTFAVSLLLLWFLSLLF